MAPHPTIYAPFERRLSDCARHMGDVGGCVATSCRHQGHHVDAGVANCSTDSERSDCCRVLVSGGGVVIVLMSVVAARMWCMVGGPALRRIAEPMVGLAPAGVRIRTRIHPTTAEAEALAAVGELLGSVYHGELAGRVRLGRLDRKAHACGGRNVSRR